MVRYRRFGWSGRSGKLTTSQNSLKSGAYAHFVLFLGEEAAGFLAVQEAFIDDFMAQDAAAAQIVRKVTSLAWKM